LCSSNHPLAGLARQIDWTAFESDFGDLCSENGRPGIPTLAMVGLHYLKLHSAPTPENHAPFGLHRLAVE